MRSALSRATRCLRRVGACTAALAALFGCVPADEAIGLGSVEFTFTASRRTLPGGMATETTDDGWSIRFDRVVLGFTTMTISHIGVDGACAFRGRGAVSNVVFDPRVGLVQTFNGIEPSECPDVGLILGPPSDQTTLGNGASFSDLVDLATGEPAHAIVEATCTEVVSAPFREPRSLRVLLRFDSLRTSSRFGGCRAGARGVRIFEGEREPVTVRFAAENLFRDAISTTTGLRVAPFVAADRDGDGIVTMAELDAYPLLRMAERFGGFYQLPNGTKSGTFGDFVRALFGFTIQFRSENGICVGVVPETERGGSRLISRNVRSR
ncbi:MAG TPA: hypothetical protein VM580_25190 [Labilithrix sp.]|nr:hypothetical protein [Labilithrix sp.]